MDLIEVAENQNRHPWELSRTSRILRELKKLGVHGNVLDIGCGDCYFDRRLLEQNSKLVVYGVDINLTQEYNDGNLHAVSNFEHLPDIKFDFVLMMDVLEHIEDDAMFLTNIIRDRLADDGIAFVTVPAFMSLYSLHDKELKHFRRYNHKELRCLVEKCGLKEKSWSYFYFSLVFGRLLTKKKSENLSMWKKSENDFLTRFVVLVLNMDFAVLSFFSRLGFHLPGLSLMSVCKKR